jgi:hypothetical protein
MGRGTTSPSCFRNLEPFLGYYQRRFGMAGDRKAPSPHPDTANFIANSAASTITAGESWENRPAKTFAST